MEGGRRAIQPVILVVDDDEYVRATIRQALRGIRAQVVDATTAAEGLKRAQDTQPSVAVLDVGLPDLDGHELARQLAAMGEPGQIAIVMVSAQMPDRDRMAEVGAEYFLAKPFRLADLHQVVAALLERVPAR